MELQFRKAARKAVPLIISVSGTSGSGKTYSALLLAAGLAKPGGRVGLLDTENGRGEMYTDSPGILRALPQGFEYARLDPQFTPARYIDAIDAAEKAGIEVLVIDSGSHEWEGYGGCTEMAEEDKGRWNRAKLQNRRFVYRLLYCSMHVIVCLRAREKTKIIPKHKSESGKEEVVSLGILPICEKNFVFEMLLSVLLDEKTHYAMPLKVPEPLLPLFQGSRMLTKEDGERVREWNEAGERMDVMDRLVQRGRAAADLGSAEYRKFWEGMTAEQRRAFPAAQHAENKGIAAAADKAIEIPVFGSAEAPVVWPDAFDGPECIFNGKHLRLDHAAGNYQEVV